MTATVPLAPHSVIGILGGGQLAKMLVQAAAELGFRAAIYADDWGPALDLASRHLIGPYENLARLYYDRGRLEDKSYLLLADLVITQALAKAKDGTLAQSADIYNIKGLLFMEQDNQVDALRAFKKAVEIQPRHADAHMNIALVAIRFRDYATAEKSVEIALADRRQNRHYRILNGRAEFPIRRESGRE